jgi:dTDP-4-dehydrorhamnose 3,5-epimerase
MKKISHNIPNLYTICFDKKTDMRGSFIKIFNDSLLSEIGINFDIKEQFYSRSVRNVVRGMHLQIPPKEHDTIVQCIEGKVIDVVIDLRKGSPTYLTVEANQMDEKKPNALLIPVGLAHGFIVKSEYATLLYTRTSEYNSSLDVGIRWDSIGINWRTRNPIVSERDNKFPILEDFNSPFIYKK